ncbi:MAG: hypothetical protein IAE97_14470 [Chthoniobacterales bacterium]|nr:hypothetical protein [Chthoniobacterales bacterium]
MRILAWLLLSACAFAAQENEGPLVVEVPPGWSVEFRQDDGTFTYVLGNGQDSELRISPKEGEVAKIPTTLAELQRGMTEKIKDSQEDSEAEVKITKGSLSGKGFKGIFARGADPATDTLSAVFVIGDKEGLLSGTYKGTKESWSRAVRFLLTLERKAEVGASQP